jgi:hypothetical protein
MPTRDVTYGGTKEGARQRADNFLSIITEAHGLGKMRSHLSLSVASRGRVLARPECAKDADLFLNVFAAGTQRNDLAVLPHSLDRSPATLIR